MNTRWRDFADVWTLSGAHPVNGNELQTALHGVADHRSARAISRNHALPDENKRLGWLTVLVFHGLNNVPLDAPDDDTCDLVIAIARGTVHDHEVATRLTLGTHQQLRERV